MIHRRERYLDCYRESRLLRLVYPGQLVGSFGFGASWFLFSGQFGL